MGSGGACDHLSLAEGLLHVLDEQAEVEVDELHDEEHLRRVQHDLVHGDNVGMAHREQNGHLTHHLERDALVTLHLPRLLERRQLHRLERHDLARLTVARLVNLVERPAANQAHILIPIDGLRTAEHVRSVSEAAS